MATVRFRNACNTLLQSITLADGLAVVSNVGTRNAAFSKFVTTTRPDWEKLAQSLLRKYKTGPEVDVEDVIQELNMAAWRYMTEFDPTRGVSFDKFIIFQAMVRAKKWVHHTRNCNLHDPDKKPSRLPIYLEDFSLRGEDCHDGCLPELLKVEPDQDVHAYRKEASAKAIRALRTVQQVYAFHAFYETWNVEEAISILVDNEDIRKKTKIRGAHMARRCIIDAVGTIAEAFS